jgi:hypothetical protein
MKCRLVILFVLATLFISATVDWGFFGHKRINRLACFTLPSDMFGFYKRNIDYITLHAVDPDKRRYASKFEAVRHYIDLDNWGTAPFERVPRSWLEAQMYNTNIMRITKNGDTLSWLKHEQIPFDMKEPATEFVFEKNNINIKEYRDFFRSAVLHTYYDDDRDIDRIKLKQFFGRYGINIKSGRYIAVENFSEHGILPYHLVQMQNRLKKAFETENSTQILRLSAEIGHYVGDAHVPLHTTKNYNGQLTDQRGIHGFWESRIPELFADKEYDYFVGKAEYIEKKQDYFWDIVLTSNSLVDSVLLIEKELSRTFPEDQQYCYTDRSNILTRTYCEEYARAYSDRMQGMVEKRFRDAILSIGSVWYTAWVDAGQPDMSSIDFTEKEKLAKEKEELDRAFRTEQIKGRKHTE